MHFYIRFWCKKLKNKNHENYKIQKKFENYKFSTKKNLEWKFPDLLYIVKPKTCILKTVKLMMNKVNG